MHKVTNFAGWLPPGYELWEDWSGLVLVHGDQRVAYFSPRATVEEIEKAVREAASK